MKSPSVTLYKETLSKNIQVPVRKTYRSLWGKTTSDVTMRRDISFGAKVLMDAFSQLGKGNEIIALSQVALADAIGGTRSTVAAALRSLEKVGLIEKFGKPIGHEQIQAFRMLHPALLRRGKDESAVTAKPDLVRCVKCRKMCVPCKTGWCRACVKDAMLDLKIDRKVDGVLTERGIVGTVSPSEWKQFVYPPKSPQK